MEMLEKQPEINIEEYKQLVERLIAEKNVEVAEEPSSRGVDYTLKNGNATLAISLGEEWIGYELDIDEAELGKPIGTSEDTDNYPLGEENVEVSKRIFDNLFECLKGFLGGGVYVGYIDKKPALAVPLANSQFKIVTRGRFSASQKEISKESLAQFSGLHPLPPVVDKT